MATAQAPGRTDYKMPISSMAAAVQPSATLAAGAKARQLKAQGIHVYDFSLGEPDFTTPEHIIQAALAAMKAGHTHYTPASGTAEVRQAIVRWYKKTYCIEYSADQVIVSNGAKHSIHNTLASVVGPGDEVIIPTPYWVSYSDLVQMTGAKYVLVHTTADSGFKMTPAQLKAALTPRSKLLMLNSPSNPTGAVYSREELESLADVVLDAGIAVLSDEIYEQLVYGDAKATCFAAMRKELVDRTVTISGASKTYAMTGWRMGWALGPLQVIKAMGNVQSQQTSCPSSISQAAAIVALDGDQSCVAQMRQKFVERRDYVCRRLQAMPGIRLLPPDGAFYAFFDVSQHFGKTLGGVKVTDSAIFCATALEKAHVNLVQGSAFGAEGYARLSFATSQQQLEGGLDHLETFLKGEIAAAIEEAIMPVLLLSEDDVRRVLTMEMALQAVEECLRQLALDEANNIPRSRAQTDHAMLHILSASAKRLGVMGYKAYATTRQSANFHVGLFDGKTGALLSLMQADYLGQMRTGAASGVATQFMARPDASEVGIFGSGKQARTQLLAVSKVRKVRRAQVYSPSSERRERFAQEMSQLCQTEVVPVPRPEMAAEDKDIVITATASREPVVNGHWLSEGTHLNVIGSNFLTKAEVDSVTVRRCDSIVVDSKDQARIEAGDFVQALEEGSIHWADIHELGQVIVGRYTGRAHPEDVTMFKSLGIGIEDVAVAEKVYAAARTQGLGQMVEW